jgi:hypothetical protein
MNNLRCLFAMLSMVCAVAYFGISASGQSTDDRNKIATITTGGTSVRWDVGAQNAGMTLTIVAPDGQVFRKEFGSGNVAEFRLTDTSERLPDGVYTYELRLSPVISSGVKEALSAARVKGNDEQVGREMQKRGAVPSQPLVQSGSFSILNGSVIIAGGIEEGASRRLVSVPKQPGFLSRATGSPLTGFRRHHPVVNPFFDFVIADDLIVQGSACVGLDCVNGEVFGFDTIRVKENNTRIQFDDTSVSAGFATNNWQIRANSSASGGGSFLGFVDQGATGNSETGTIVFEVDAGAPANSLRVSSLGRIGVRTATPVLDIHANTNNTPAMRLEQNNSGGFSAQTWDIAGNEANFFVRDVTSGSTLPLRIRPGAPTSSLDISADGDVGIGTGSPGTRLDVFGNTTTIGSDSGATTRTNGVTKLSRVAIPPFTSTNLNFAYVAAATTNTDNIAAVGGAAAGAAAATLIVFHTAGNTNTDSGTERMRITSIGRVGIGTTAPDQLLSVNGDASKGGGGSWQVFSDERLKNIKGPYNSGLKAVMQLQPLRYEYKANNALGIKPKGEHVGFGAQSVQQVIPEAVTQNDQGYLLVNNDPIMWTMLNAIKEQQKQIEQLKAEVRKLRQTSRRRK